MDSHKTWTVDGSQPKTDPINFGAGPDKDPSVLFFDFFFYILIN